MDRIYCERFCFNWPVSLFFEEREIKRERERESAKWNQNSIRVQHFCGLLPANTNTSGNGSSADSSTCGPPLHYVPHLVSSLGHIHQFTQVSQISIQLDCDVLNVW